MTRSTSKKKRPPESTGMFFMDSGAHSLFNINVHAAKHRSTQDRYRWFDTDEFWDYVDEYAEYIKDHLDVVDYYANVDVIHNPDRSWEVQKHLEEVHGLNPVPVVHQGASPRVLEKYLDAGYDYIGLGGVALKGTRMSYLQWADRMFEVLCPPPKRIPIVKVHGFAMTAYGSLTRYPWWSVDSASWTKAGAFGSVLMPHKRKGEWDFSIPPYSIGMSKLSTTTKAKDQHILNVPEADRKIMLEWLEYIGVPYDEPNDENDRGVGVLNHHSERKIANLMYYEHLVDWLYSNGKSWPWEFRIEGKRIANQLPRRPFFGAAETKKRKPPKWKKTKLTIFYSGSTTGRSLPEQALYDKKPSLMLTFFEIRAKSGEAFSRFKRHTERRRKERES